MVYEVAGVRPVKVHVVAVASKVPQLKLLPFASVAITVYPVSGAETVPDVPEENTGADQVTAIDTPVAEVTEVIAGAIVGADHPYHVRLDTPA